MSRMVFRGYTAKQLEEQYNARAAVPGHEKFFEDWRTRSADYRRRSVCELDIPYGSSEREKLDLFIPRRRNSPVHVFIHGGYWRLMDKSDFSYLAEGLVDGGALVAVVNYGLCPSVTMDEIVENIQTACQWLWRNCSKYGGNADAIHVSGHSAGGHLTAMLIATDWPSFSPELPVDLVKSGVPISGLFELEPMRHIPLNNDLKLEKDMADRNSPTLLNPRTCVPMTVVVGGDESDEFRRQSTDFAESWRERRLGVEYVEMSGLNHFTVVDQLKNPANPLTEKMLLHMGLI